MTRKRVVAMFKSMAMIVSSIAALLLVGCSGGRTMPLAPADPGRELLAQQGYVLVARALGVTVLDDMDNIALARTADAWSRTGRVSVQAEVGHRRAAQRDGARRGTPQTRVVLEMEYSGAPASVDPGNCRSS